MNISEDKLLFVYKNYGVTCPNEYYEIDENTIAIKARNISGDVQYSLIDKEDFEKVKVCNWKLKKDCLTYYLHNSRFGFLHRLIMDPPENLQIDHKDGNGLNNKKENLRIVNGETNAKNKHYVTGLSFDDIKGYPRFRVKWNENKKQKQKDFSLSEYGSLDKAYEEAKKFRIEIECNVYDKPQVQGNSTPIVNMGN